ncbi:lactonase family protein [Seonamhaeicola marinus]|uniref:Lactonase family protein n=1 Tax=Seonamhaeicola marinus TaxID=1912246 RepID=A0A5D0HF71_9FLAO|nr:lactonase family protein [Seonamhaeicola marinus]TYA70003.1 lactonase family protein [Seonamhaeicola marinus]
MKLKLVILVFALNIINLFSQDVPLYIGTFTNEDSKGIYHTTFNTETGQLGTIELAIAIDDPSFLAYSPNRKQLYSAHKNGFISSYNVEENGQLSLLTRVKSEGKGACHIAVNETGDKAISSNYGGGTSALLPIANDGSLLQASQVFNKNSENKKSRAHSAFFYKDELYVAYLGKNAVSQYKLAPNSDTYELSSKAIVDVSGNPGPRHFTFTKDGNYVYIINELGCSISAGKRTSNGFDLIETVSTLPKDFKDKNSCADIHLSEDEQFLYGSNRGENTIAVFKRNAKTGSIKRIQNMSVHGDWPRNFTLDPSGNFLLVANQKSNNISVFKVNTSTGKLSFLYDVKTPTPVCLLF